jgi:flagellar hook assembly protein FlgD
VLDVSPGEAPPSRPGATAFARAPAPNPSSGAVRFAVSVPGAQQVELVVRDLAGRRMAVLHRGALAAGTHSFTWNGSTSAGTSAPAGVYFVQLRAAGVQSSQRVLRVR